jgi:hypothetical protein
MPLQKLPHQGPPAADPQTTKRRQLQERRRTLQTISELSTTEVPLPELRTCIADRQIPLVDRVGAFSSTRNPSNVNKRRSLPQYCTNSDYMETQNLLASSSPHVMTTQRMPAGPGLQTRRSPRLEAGWNARRDHARMQAEQALAGHSSRRKASQSNFQTDLTSTRQSTSAPLHMKTSQPHLRSCYSQQYLLRNSRSMTSTPFQIEQYNSLGQPSNHIGPYDNEAESTERHSTDSSSYLSSHDSTVRRSRSSSSSQSFTLQGVPPLPTGCAQPTRTYYTAITSPYHNGYPFQLPGPMYGSAAPEMRTSSLPYMRVNHFNKHFLNQAPGTSLVIPTTHLVNNHNAAQRPRPKSVSSRSASGRSQVGNKHASHPSVPSQLPLYSTSLSTTITHLSLSSHPITPSNRQASSSVQVPRAKATSLQRSVPDRSALTKWKTGREEARDEFDGLQRARVKERVRRANEMEQEKEKELQALGMGMGTKKSARVLWSGSDTERKGVRGCFGGVFGRIWGRGR